MQDQDFALTGDYAFFFTRRYSNHSRYAGPFGTGWMHPFDVHVSFQPDHVLVVDEEARQIKLPVPINGQPVESPGEAIVGRVEEQQLVLHRRGQRLAFAPVPSVPMRLPLVRLDTTDENTLWFEYRNGFLDELRTTSGQVLHFEHDPAGRVRRIALQSGSQLHSVLATYDYDAVGQLVHARDAAGNATSYEYTDGLLTRYTNRLGGSYYLEYDRQRRCTAVWQDGFSCLRTFRYDSQKHTTLVTDSLGHSTLLRYDKQYLLRETIRSDGSTIKREYANGNEPMAVVGLVPPPPLRLYDDSNRLVKEVGPGGETTAWEYDKYGRVVQETDSLGGATRFEYDNYNHVVRWATPLGRTEFEFTEAGSLRSKLTPLGNRVVATRHQGSITLADSMGPLLTAKQDEAGNTVEIVRATGRKTVFTHDKLGRLIALSTGGHTSVREYDALGYVRRTVDLAGNENRYERDPFGLLLKWTNAAGLEVTYEYDSERRLVRSSTSTGAQCRYTYDLYGRLQKQLLRDGRTEEFEYDEHGHRSSVIVVGEVTTRYRYTPGGFISEISSGNHRAQFEYDPAGHCTCARTGAHVVKREYAPGDLLVSEDQDGFQVSYEYNAAGLVTARSDSKGRRASFGYNLRGQLLEMADAVTGTHRFEYDEYGRRAAHILPNGLVRRYQYDGDDQVACVRTYKNDELLTERSYRYTPTGELSSMNTGDAEQEEFFYDGAYQLLVMSGDSATSETFRYDLDGNLVSSSAVGEFAYEGLRLRSAGPLRYSYDSAGRVIGRSFNERKMSFQYGLGGLIVTAGEGAEVYSYEYDGFGRRVVKRGPGFTVRYYWDRDVLLSEVRTDRNGTTVTAYAFMPGTFRPLGHAQNQARFCYDLDQRALIREVYDDTGAVVGSFRYRAFGERITLDLRNPLADVPFRLLGQFHDAETGLHCNRFRYYDPAVGRFLSPDPYLHEVAHNPYAYAPNPISWADPFGLMPDFSESFKDELKEENKDDNGGFFTCEHCGFKHTQRVFAKTKETGKPVGDGSFHADHAVVPNADGGAATKENAAVLGGTCNCSKGKRKEPGMT